MIPTHGVSVTSPTLKMYTFCVCILVFKIASQKYEHRRPQACVGVGVCPSQAILWKLLKSSPSNLASDMGMHHVLLILPLTFIQGHTDLNH